jgi:hypothetical protein
MGNTRTITRHDLVYVKRVSTGDTVHVFSIIPFLISQFLNACLESGVSSRRVNFVWRQVPKNVSQRKWLSKFLLRDR